MNNYLFIRLCFGFCLLAAQIPAFAYQVADGTAPSLSPPVKYIFYWGKHQCDLSEATGYKGSITLSPADFRQLLVGAPKIWNGKDIVKNITFRLEGLTVSAEGYLGQLAQLDAQLGPVAQPGKVLHLTDLTLEAGVWGAIDLNIEAKDDTKTKTVRGYSPFQGYTFLNDQFLDAAVWGREDIYETSNRDYFTVREFWQTVRQEPAVEWKSYLKPQTLRSDINFISKDKTTFSVVARFDVDTYGSMLENLENYRHMVHPGAIVTLQLQTAEQYDLLYKKTMNIVADDDPRLRLRRKRDQHNLTLKWGLWFEKINDLYLTHLSSPQGETVPADAPLTRTSSIRLADTSAVSWGHWGQEKPRCLIDDEPVSGNISFRFTVADSMVFHINTAHYDPDSIVQVFAQKGLIINSLLIDSIQVEGYELPPMELTIYNFRQFDRVLARNEFNVLQTLSLSASRAKLLPPAPTATALEFKLEMPESSAAMLTIYEPDGWNNYVKTDKFNAGQTTVSIPRSVFRNKGRHIAFLNTAVGVSKVEFEIE